MPATDVECERALRFIDKNLERVRQVLEEFPEDKIWERPRDGVASLGNVVCHLAGSMRDWFENGIGQGKWIRDRDQEFMRNDGFDKNELLQHLETASHSRSQIAEFTSEYWDQPRQFRDKTYTVREIILHQLEHIAYHAGQAAFLRWMVGELPLRA